MFQDVKVVKGEKEGEEGQQSYGWGEKEGEEEQRTAHYLSANCVIFTYHSGEVSAALDTHFTASLSPAAPSSVLPLASRQLPPSFWDSGWKAPVREEPYSAEYADPWQQYMAAQVWLICSSTDS